MSPFDIEVVEGVENTTQEGGIPLYAAVQDRLRTWNRLWATKWQVAHEPG